MTGKAIGNVRYDAAPLGWNREVEKLQKQAAGTQKAGPDMGVHIEPRPQPWRLPLTASAPEQKWRLAKK